MHPIIFGFTQHQRYRHPITRVYLWVSFIYIIALIYFIQQLVEEIYIIATLAIIPVTLSWLLTYYYHYVLPYLDKPQDEQFEDILDA